MSEKNNVSAGKRARLLIAVIALAIVALEVWGISYSRKVQIDETRASISNVTRALSQHAEDTLREADIVIVDVLERLQQDGLSPAGMDRTRRALLMRLQALRQIDGVYVINEEGNLLISSQEKSEADQDKLINATDRSYYSYHRSHSDLDVHLGVPIQSRSTGRWGFTLSRRYNKPDGQFGGVVVANIHMDYFEKFYRSFDIGDAGAIVLIRSDGILLYRRPMRADMAGKNMAGTELYRAYQTNNLTGSALIKSSQDGVTRINVYRSVLSYPVFVAVAMSEDEILADWRRESILHGGSVALLLMALLYVGNTLVSMVNRRSKSEADAIDAQARAERLSRSLEELAMKDVLTGMPNRRQFDAMLKTELDLAREHHTAVSLIMLDIDHFKLFNHLYGHVSSDECLCAIAAAIKSSLQQIPYLAARYGGEQFGIILPGSSQFTAITFAEKISEAVRELAIPHWENESGVVSVSIGVSCLDPVDENDLGADLIRSADHALHTAKQRGHDQVASFSLPKITPR